MAERFCQHRDRFGNRCGDLINHEGEFAYCRWHYPRPGHLVARDVGPPMDRRVYFVFAAESEVVKIGTTKNLKKRLGQLNHASPTPLILLGSIEGGLQVERWFHNECIRSRSHLEWFHWTPSVCALIDRALRLGPGAAREMCGAEYQTDRSDLGLTDGSRLPYPQSADGLRKWLQGKRCCGFTCPAHLREAE